MTRRRYIHTLTPVYTPLSKYKNILGVANPLHGSLLPFVPLILLLSFVFVVLLSFLFVLLSLFFHSFIPCCCPCLVVCAMPCPSLVLRYCQCWYVALPCAVTSCLALLLLLLPMHMCSDMVVWWWMAWCPYLRLYLFGTPKHKGSLYIHIGSVLLPQTL